MHVIESNSNIHNATLCHSNGRTNPHDHHPAARKSLHNGEYLVLFAVAPSKVSITGKIASVSYG